MMLIYEMVEMLASFIEIYVLYSIFQGALYRYRQIENRLPEIILSLFGIVIVRVCNHITIFTYALTLFFVLYISISAKFLYKTQYITLVSISSFYFLCLVSFDFLILSILASISGGMEALTELVSNPGIPRMAMIIGIKTCWIIAFLIVKKYLKRFSEISIKGKQVLIVSVLGFLGLIFLVEQTFEAFNYKLTGAWLLLVVVCILLIFVFYFCVTIKEEKMRLEFTEMRNQILENNYESVSNLYESNAKLYHDLNNHLNVLYQLLEEGNATEAKSYISEISKPISVLEKISWTGMDVVDVVINSKVHTMKEKGIQARINVEFPHNTGIMPNDMCTILANLLDNAIEATQKIDGEQKISLTIRRINHFIMIKVANPCIGLKNKLDGDLTTTKENHRMHGWGIPSVRSTVEKYNGVFKYDIKDGLFVVKIMLCFGENIK